MIYKLILLTLVTLLNLVKSSEEPSYFNLNQKHVLQLIEPISIQTDFRYKITVNCSTFQGKFVTFFGTGSNNELYLNNVGKLAFKLSDGSVTTSLRLTENLLVDQDNEIEVWVISGQMGLKLNGQQQERAIPHAFNINFERLSGRSWNNLFGSVISAELYMNGVLSNQWNINTNTLIIEDLVGTNDVYITDYDSRQWSNYKGDKFKTYKELDMVFHNDVYVDGQLPNLEIEEFFGNTFAFAQDSWMSFYVTMHEISQDIKWMKYAQEAADFIFDNTDKRLDEKGVLNLDVKPYGWGTQEVMIRDPLQAHTGWTRGWNHNDFVGRRIELLIDGIICRNVMIFIDYAKKHNIVLENDRNDEYIQQCHDILETHDSEFVEDRYKGQENRITIDGHYYYTSRNHPYDQLYSDPIAFNHGAVAAHAMILINKYVQNEAFMNKAKLITAFHTRYFQEYHEGYKWYYGHKKEGDPLTGVYEDIGHSSYSVAFLFEYYKQGGMNKTVAEKLTRTVLHFSNEETAFRYVNGTGVDQGIDTISLKDGYLEYSHNLRFQDVKDRILKIMGNKINEKADLYHSFYDGAAKILKFKGIDISQNEDAVLCENFFCEALSGTPICKDYFCKGCSFSDDFCEGLGKDCDADSGRCVEKPDPCALCNENQICQEKVCINKCDLCTENQICQDNQCVDRQTPSPCESCTENQICQDNQCVERQTPSVCDSCTENQICQDNQCVERQIPSACDSCTENQICQDNQCVDRQTPSGCENCRDDQVCEEGECRDVDQNENGCESSNDCGLNSNTPYCDRGVAPSRCVSCNVNQLVCENSDLVCNFDTGACQKPLEDPNLVEIQDEPKSVNFSKNLQFQVLFLIVLILSII